MRLRASSEMWIQHSTSSTAWSAWTRFATTADIPTLSTLGATPANVAITATSNTDTTTNTSAVASTSVVSVMQTIWAKVRSVVNALALKANDADVVKLTGNQTIVGTKTFSTSPIVPSKTSAAETSGTAIATEAQVKSIADGAIADAKIENRTLVDHAANAIVVPVAAKLLTAWLQGIRDNLKYLFNHKFYHASQISVGSGSCDLNTYTNPGLYPIYLASGGTLSNFPSGCSSSNANSVMFFVNSVYASSVVSQVLFHCNSNAIWYRNCSGNIFKTWEQVASVWTSKNSQKRLRWLRLDLRS